MTKQTDSQIAPRTPQSAEVDCPNINERFSIERIHTLLSDDLVIAQSLAGHGSIWGTWQNPDSVCPGKLHPSFRSIDLRRRLLSFLDKAGAPTLSSTLLDEGVLTYTRWALLLRLAPANLRIANSSRRLKPSSIANYVYQHIPRIISRALQRKVQGSIKDGLLTHLSADDVLELSKNEYVRIELDRLELFFEMGYWTDIPTHFFGTRLTNPRGPAIKGKDHIQSQEYLPISDDYLAELSPRILWLILDLAPNLLSLLEGFADKLRKLDWQALTPGKLRQDSGIVSKFIRDHLADHPWKDREGKPLSPPFRLALGSANARNKFEWPPRTYQNLQALSVTLQSAHLFLVLLATAARTGEVETLRRSCVTTKRDGRSYIEGWTYKLSRNFLGESRDWPAPVVLVQALGQQSRLAEIWSRLPAGSLVNGLPTSPVSHDYLWLSLGTTGSSNAAKPLGHPGAALNMLASRVDMSPTPDGVNLHPHRCRKTIGRLAGVAMFNSPIGLKRLFGHRSIEMTLHYILCDADIRAEAEAVLRELRVIHCAETIEEIRNSLKKDSLRETDEENAAARVASAVEDHEVRLVKSGRLWNQGSAYELAQMLTLNGQGWRLVRKNIVCTKIPGEAGACSKNRGNPNLSNCQSNCRSRLVLNVELERRDSQEIIDSYIELAIQARNDEQYLVFFDVMQRLREELEKFPDLGERYKKAPTVISLLATLQEIESD